MTQPLLSRQSDTKQEIDKNSKVQNNFENVIKLKCVKCEKLFNERELAIHLKVHAVPPTTMGKGSVELVKNSKTVVKLETMNFPIKRKAHGSNGSSSKRIKLQDGETELSVDNTVPKVLCKSCKPPKYFQDVEALQYHLVMSHNVSKSSSYFKNPSMSPAKNVFSKPSLETPKKVRVRSQSGMSEIKDMENLETEELSSTTPASESVSTGKSSGDNVDSESSLGGKFRELLKVRRMKMKRVNAANCRTPKLQPPCLSEKSDLVPKESMEEDKSKKVDSLKDEGEVNPSSKLEQPNRRKLRGSLDLNKSNNDPVSDVNVVEPILSSVPSKPKGVDENSSKDNSKTFAVPAPVRKSGRAKPPKPPEVKQSPTENPRRRVSERRFDGVKPYKCNHCKLSFSSLENKKVHEQTHIEKNLLCLYCDMRFYFPLCLKRHSRIHKS